MRVHETRGPTSLALSWFLGALRPQHPQYLEPTAPSMPRAHSTINTACVHRYCNLPMVGGAHSGSSCCKSFSGADQADVIETRKGAYRGTRHMAVGLDLCNQISIWVQISICTGGVPGVGTTLERTRANWGVGPCEQNPQPEPHTLKPAPPAPTPCTLTLNPKL